MPLTRQQLDEIVDVNVTNKTEPLSLTPQQEGFAIKTVADYVDDNKQDLSQKSQDISVDADSEDKYPSVKAVVDYSEKIGNKKQEVTGESEDFYLSEKAVVNYVESELTPITEALENIQIVAKIQKTTIPLSDVQQLNTVPYTVLQSDGNTLRFPLAIYIRRSSTSAYTLANDYFDLTTLGGSFYGFSIPCAVLAYAGAAYVYYNFPFSSNGNGLGADGFKLKANVGNPSGGTGGLDVYVIYTEIVVD